MKNSIINLKSRQKYNFQRTLRGPIAARANGYGESPENGTNLLVSAGNVLPRGWLRQESDLLVVETHGAGTALPRTPGRLAGTVLPRVPGRLRRLAPDIKSEADFVSFSSRHAEGRN